MRKRNCLYAAAWPPAERRALERALGTTGLFSTAEAALWAKSMLHRYCRGYGTWLHYLSKRGMLRAEDRAAARASPEVLRAFVAHLADEGLAPVSIHLTLKGLLKILGTIDPQGCPEELVRLAKRWRRIAQPRRDKTRVLVGASNVYDAGLSRMHAILGAPFDQRNAGRYMDGLLMSMLISCPVRLRNLQETRVGRHVCKTPGGAYAWRIGKAETKSHRSVVAELPSSLTRYIDHWLSELRPRLMREKSHEAFWVSSLGDPASRTTLYTRCCAATQEALGVRMHPHAFRYAAATSIAVSMPDQAELVPYVLANDARTAREYYEINASLGASYVYVQQLQARRKR